MKHELIINNLHARVEDKDILKGVNLRIKAGEVHAIMGPNGTGKSTLASVIMGHYKYEVTAGEIIFDGKNVLDLSVDERSRLGIFLAMQYPNEISGVTNADFIRAAVQARQPEGKNMSIFTFMREYDRAVEELKMRSDLPHRYLNEGFSGGEKKRNEILQMKMLKPKLAILDEIDSGLDVDALKIVGQNINNMRDDSFSALVITHYERLTDYIDVDYVHVILDGRIVKTGGKEIVARIDAEGYDWIKEEANILPENNNQKISLGTCAHSLASK